MLIRLAERCGLTFLAIQAPGLCNFCGICGKQYLKSSSVEIQNPIPGVTNDIEMDPTIIGKKPLSEQLAAACNKCVYCGGKFVG